MEAPLSTTTAKTTVRTPEYTVRNLVLERNVIAAPFIAVPFIADI
jgi:hypothetical protein